MAYSFLESEDHAALKLRLQALQPDTMRQWGTLTAHQMLVHCTDQLRVCTGDKPISTRLPGWLKPVAKWVLFNLMPKFPKNMGTLKELDPAREMTLLTTFTQDRVKLLALLEPNRYAGRATFEHPAFGRLTAPEFGNVVWKHLDHHLRQFGV